jgi:hypothetical protein
MNQNTTLSIPPRLLYDIRVIETNSTIYTGENDEDGAPIMVTDFSKNHYRAQLVFTPTPDNGDATTLILNSSSYPSDVPAPESVKSALRESIFEAILHHVSKQIPTETPK